jgi:hypothetical protein
VQARGRFHYAREDFHTALRDFQLIADLMARWQMDLPAHARERGISLRVLAECGEPAKRRPPRAVGEGTPELRRPRSDLPFWLHYSTTDGH